MGDQHVHVDLIGGSGSGPGFSVRALLIHIDGEFSASGWLYGCLGGGGNCFPAIARLNATFAVIGDYPEGGYDGLPFIVLRTATPEGD